MGRVVYLIAGNGEHVKIGHSTDLHKRLETLNTASPCELRIVATFPGGQAEERAVHWLFDHLRVRAEWFSDIDREITRWFLARQMLSSRHVAFIDKTVSDVSKKWMRLHAPKRDAIAEMHNAGALASVIARKLETDPRYVTSVISKAGGTPNVLPYRRTVNNATRGPITDAVGKYLRAGLTMATIQLELSISRKALRRIMRTNGWKANGRHPPSRTH